MASSIPVAPLPMIGAVPMAFPVSPPLLMGPGGSPDASMWICEMQFMAARLQGLAASVPQSLQPHSRAAEVSTAITLDNLATWEAMKDRLEGLRAEASSLDEAVISDQAEQAHQECLEAEAEAHQLRAEVEGNRQSRLEEHRAASAALAAAARRAADARDAAKAAEEAFRSRADTASEKLVHLRRELDREAQTTQAAQRKASDALVARENAKDLPALRKRKHAAGAQVASLREENDNLRRQIEAVRAETDTSLQSGNGARAEALEARVTQLDGECRALQQEVGGSSSASCSGEGSTADAGDELPKAQDRNRRLVAEAAEARRARDEAQSALMLLEKENVNLQKRLQLNRSEVEDIKSQIADHEFRRAAALHEVESKRMQITVLERRSRDVEAGAKASQAKHQEAWAATRHLTLQRQRHEQTSTLLEWRLQNALAQLEKVKPGAPLSRCLRQKGNLGAYKVRNRDRMGGSECGSESVDADVSTTAGESVADTLLDLGHACS